MAPDEKKPALDKAKLGAAFAKIGDRIMNNTDGLGDEKVADVETDQERFEQYLEENWSGDEDWPDDGDVEGDSDIEVLVGRIQDEARHAFFRRLTKSASVSEDAYLATHHPILEAVVKRTAPGRLGEFTKNAASWLDGIIPSEQVEELKPLAAEFIYLAVNDMIESKLTMVFGPGSEVRDETKESEDFKAYYRANILNALNEVVEETAAQRQKERAKQWRDEIPPEWDTQVEQRVAAEIEEWEKQGRPQE